MKYDITTGELGIKVRSLKEVKELNKELVERGFINPLDKDWLVNSYVQIKPKNKDFTVGIEKADGQIMYSLGRSQWRNTVGFRAYKRCLDKLNTERPTPDFELENKALIEDLNSLIEASRHFDEKYDQLKLSYDALKMATDLLSSSHEERGVDLERANNALFKLIDKL